MAVLMRTPRNFAQAALVAAILLAAQVSAPAQEKEKESPAADAALMEMKKWIATNDATWQAAFKRDVTDVSEAELAKVKQQYRDGIEASSLKASGAGDLDAALALREEAVQ